MKVCLITERRVFSPQGIKGGENGAKGENYLIDDEKVYLIKIMLYIIK